MDNFNSFRAPCGAAGLVNHDADFTHVVEAFPPCYECAACHARSRCEYMSIVNIAAENTHFLWETACGWEEAEEKI